MSAEVGAAGEHALLQVKNTGLAEVGAELGEGQHFLEKRFVEGGASQIHAARVDLREQCRFAVFEVVMPIAASMGRVTDLNGVTTRNSA
jgi:hypothetical protein